MSDNLLLDALNEHNFKEALYLLETGRACPNEIEDDTGVTPLHLAIESNQLEIVRILLEQGAEINIITKEGYSPLHTASQRGNIDILKLLLLKEDANIHEHLQKSDYYNIEYNLRGNAFHIAAICGHLNVVRLFLDHKANIDGMTKEHETAVYLAAEYGHLEIVQLLLSKGAYIGNATRNGETAFTIAVREGHLSIVKLLLSQLSQNIDTHRLTNYLNTALYIAAERGHLRIVKWFLAKGAEVNYLSTTGKTALYIATENGHLEIMERLLAHKADANLICKETFEEKIDFTPILKSFMHLEMTRPIMKDHFSALHIAAEKGDIKGLKALKVLLLYGADINQTTPEGQTALHIAIQHNRLEIAYELLRQGANVNLSDKKGLTPLHIAAQHNRLEIAYELLRQRAKANLSDKNGLAPLHIAAQQQDLSATALILAFLASSPAEYKKAFSTLIDLRTELPEIDRFCKDSLNITLSAQRLISSLLPLSYSYATLFKVVEIALTQHFHSGYNEASRVFIDNPNHATPEMAYLLASQESLKENPVQTFPAIRPLLYKTSYNGETALYLAAKAEHLGALRLLIQWSGYPHKALPPVPERLWEEKLTEPSFHTLSGILRYTPSFLEICLNKVLIHSPTAEQLQTRLGFLLHSSHPKTTFLEKELLRRQEKEHSKSHPMP